MHALRRFATALSLALATLAASGLLPVTHRAETARHDSSETQHACPSHDLAAGGDHLPVEPPAPSGHDADHCPVCYLIFAASQVHAPADAGLVSLHDDVASRPIRSPDAVAASRPSDPFRQRGPPIHA